MSFFTKEQFKQLITALAQFGEYEEWQDAFNDTIRSYKYGTDEIQLKHVYDESSDNRTICVETSLNDGWETVTIIEDGPDIAGVYGKEYSFDELISMFPKSIYDEKEWLDML